MLADFRGEIDDAPGPCTNALALALMRNHVTAKSAHEHAAPMGC